MQDNGSDTGSDTDNASVVSLSTCEEVTEKEVVISPDVCVYFESEFSSTSQKAFLSNTRILLLYMWNGAMGRVTMKCEGTKKYSQITCNIGEMAKCLT